MPRSVNFQCPVKRKVIITMFSLKHLMNNEIPTCECLDWQRNYLPCKHMLAIIQNKRYDSWNWEKLPPEYRESPFLTLDAEILFQPIEHILHNTDESKQSCSRQSGIANLEKQKEEIFHPISTNSKTSIPQTNSCH